PRAAPEADRRAQRPRRRPVRPRRPDARGRPAHGRRRRAGAPGRRRPRDRPRVRPHRRRARHLRGGPADAAPRPQGPRASEGVPPVGEPGIYLSQLELGPMQNFVYLVGDPVARECVVVDPAWEIDTIVDTARADGMRLTGALVTHTHQDHVGGSLASWGMPGRIPGVEELLARVPLKVYVHKAEREFLPGLGSDLVQVDNHDTLSIGRLALTFLHTP